MRGQHLDVLLETLTAQANIARQYIPSSFSGGHSPTHGRAAELGLGDVLQAVFPGRLRVSTGFIRRGTDSLLAEAGDAQSLSGQTDVLIYDWMETAPIHSIGEIDIIAEPDVRGYFEVKDTVSIAPELASAVEQIERVRQLQSHGRFALAGIFMVQGGSSNFRTSLKSALDALRQKSHAPDLVYARALGCSPENNWASRHGTLFYRVHGHGEMRGLRCKHPKDALALFLRLVIGWFADQGLISPALAHGMAPTHGDDCYSALPEIELDSGVIDPRYERTIKTESHSVYEVVQVLLDHVKDHGYGSLQLLQYPGFYQKDDDDDKWPRACLNLCFVFDVRKKVMLSFLQSINGTYRCADGPNSWLCHGETPFEQLRRLMRQKALGEGLDMGALEAVFLPRDGAWSGSADGRSDREPSQFGEEE